MRNFLKPKVISFMLLGVIAGGLLFILGDADDAPGLSFIGLVVAFVLIMRGIYHAKILREGYHIPIILLVFGMIGMIFPFILFLDGELGGFSGVIWIGLSVGILLIAAAVMRIRKVKRNKQDAAAGR